MENLTNEDVNNKEPLSEDAAMISKDEFAELFQKMDEKQMLELLAASGESDIPSQEEPVKARKSIRNFISKNRKRIVFVLALEFLILVVAVGIFYMTVPLNKDEPLHNQSASEEIDEISAQEGLLKVNNVSVPVPSTGDEEYNISYAWSETDTDYPSIPRTVTATYGEKGSTKYNLTLYRQETVKKEDVPSGKDADNWFSDWEASTEDGIKQGPISTKTIKGFYISPYVKAGSEDSSEYNTFTCYFSVPDEASIKVYVFEGTSEDIAYRKELSDVMKEAISKIRIESKEKSA